MCPFKCLTRRSTAPPPPAGGLVGTLNVPDAWNNREGPQAREPSNCLVRWSYGETGQRDFLIASYKRLKKRL